MTDVPAALKGPERERRYAAARHEALARSAIALYTQRRVDPPRLKFLSRNLGSRQNNRLLCATVLDVPIDSASVARALREVSGFRGARNRFSAMGTAHAGFTKLLILNTFGARRRRSTSLTAKLLVG